MFYFGLDPAPSPNEFIHSKNVCSTPPMHEALFDKGPLNKVKFLKQGPLSLQRCTGIFKIVFIIVRFKKKQLIDY